MINQLNTIIIEDEVNSQKLLSDLLIEYCPDVVIVGMTNSVIEGIQLISNTSCDLLFLDVELEDGLSFEILDKLDQKNFSIVMTTAYDHYAFKAFKYQALDYLLKPYSPRDLIKTIEKVKKTKSSVSIDQIKSLFSQINHSAPKKINLTTHEGMHIVDLEQVLYCTADGAYCKVHLKDQSPILVSKTLSEVEDIVTQEHFVRIHASHLININHVKKYLKDDGGSIVMADNKVLPVSRRKKQEFLERLR